MFGFLKKRKKSGQQKEELVQSPDPETDYSAWPELSELKGYGEEISRLENLADTIKRKAKGEIAYGYYPKGILLSGDPGTGKTTAAKGFIRLVGDVPTVVVPASPEPELVEQVFEEAASIAPCFVLIDDVDRLIPIDDPFSGFVSDQTNIMLKTLLSCIDGVSQAPGVMVVMTANSYYEIDPALRRPGRIDLHIPFGLPDDKSREEIAEHYLSLYGGAFPPDLAPVVAKRMAGLTGAQIKTIVNDVFLYNSKGGPIDRQSAIDAFQKRIMEISTEGILKKANMKEEDFERICYHEAGHAVVNYFELGECSDVCVLQQEGSDFGGWTATRDTDDTSMFHSAKDCMRNVATYLGGLVAEKKKYGNWTTGVCSDMDAARRLIASFQFCCLANEAEDPDFSVLPALMPNILENMGSTPSGDIQTHEKRKGWNSAQEDILSAGYKAAKADIEGHMPLLEAVAKRLMQKYIVSAEALKSIIAEVEDKK